MDDPGGSGPSAERFPRLNRALVAEVEYTARLSNHIKFGEVAWRAMAKDSDRRGRQETGQARVYMSEEGLAGIMVKGSEPKPDTLRKLARYARYWDASYSVGRLYRAAGWYDDDDPAFHRDEGPSLHPLTPAQAQLCLAIPRLSEEHVELLLRVAEQFLKADHDQAS